MSSFLLGIYLSFFNKIRYDKHKKSKKGWIFMKLVSWNVNGLRACITKGFYDSFKEIDADIFCLQETKMQPGQAEIISEGYYQYLNSAVNKGYSGTMVFTKKEPISVSYGIGIEEHDQEGRVITLEFDHFYMVTVYTPNSGDGLKRLDYRMEWDKVFRAFVKGLEKAKPVLICGDLNVANEEIDIKNPKANRKNAGFTDEERNSFKETLKEGFVDTFRYLYPEEVKYSWWSYRFKARERNAGWRIDYWLVSDCLKEKVKDAQILNDVFGSDHCPVVLDIEL